MTYAILIRPPKRIPTFKQTDRFPTNIVIDKPHKGWEDWIKKHAEPVFDKSKTGERVDQRKRQESEETLGLDGETV